MSSFYQGIVLSIIELVGDYGAKVQNLPLSLLGYNTLSIYLTSILGKSDGASLTLINSNWDGISNLMTMALGYAIGERFSTSQHIGLILISFGLFLL